MRPTFRDKRPGTVLKMISNSEQLGTEFARVLKFNSGRANFKSFEHQRFIFLRFTVQTYSACDMWVVLPMISCCDHSAVQASFSL